MDFATPPGVIGSGLVAVVEPADFLEVVRRQTGAMVVYAHCGWFFKDHQYLTGYKGVTFYTRSQVALDLPEGIELLRADAIWIPS